MSKVILKVFFCYQAAEEKNYKIKKIFWSKCVISSLNDSFINETLGYLCEVHLYNIQDVFYFTLTFHTNQARTTNIYYKYLEYCLRMFSFDRYLFPVRLK